MVPGGGGYRLELLVDPAAADSLGGARHEAKAAFRAAWQRPQLGREADVMELDCTD